MIALQKIRITVASNGASKSNALLVKDGRGRFFILSDSALPMPANDDNIMREFADRLFPHIEVPSNGLVFQYKVDPIVTRSLDSFATAILAMETTTISTYGNYRYEMVEGGFSLLDINGDIPTIRLGDAQSVSDTTGIAIKSGYTRQYTYTGMEGYHSSIASTNGRHRAQFNTPLSPDKPWRIGVELELYARTRDAYNKITGVESNWFQCERDGSLSESIDGVSGLGIEMKTIPLKACDAKSVDFWAAPMAKLAQLAKSKNNHSTGLHVHIGKEILGNSDVQRQKTLDKLTWFYYYLIEDVPENHAKNVKICGRERGYSTSPDAGKTELADFAKSIGFDAVQKAPEAFNKMAKTVKDKVSGLRDDINLAHLNDYGTIEFRKGKGAIGKTRLAAIVTWWEQMCLYCRDTDPANLSFSNFFEKVTGENPAVAYFFNTDEEV